MALTWRKGENPNGLVADLKFFDADGVEREVESIEWDFGFLQGTVDSANDKHVEIAAPNFDELQDGATCVIQATADARFGEETKPIILTETIVFVVTPEAVTGELLLTPAA